MQYKNVNTKTTSVSIYETRNVAYYFIILKRLSLYAYKIYIYNIIISTTGRRRSLYCLLRELSPKRVIFLPAHEILIIIYTIQYNMVFH